MAILGLILLLAAGGLTLDVVVKNTSNINVNAVGQTFTLSPGWLFVAGVVAGAVGLLGVTMILGSVARAHRRPVVLARYSSGPGSRARPASRRPLPRAGSQDPYSRRRRCPAGRAGDGRARRGGTGCDVRHDELRWE